MVSQLHAFFLFFFLSMFRQHCNVPGGIPSSEMMPQTGTYGQLRVVFVLDNSTSMLRKSNGGMSFLDVAKAFIERVLVQSSSRPVDTNDGLIYPVIERFFLVTTDGTVHIGWNSSSADFLRVLRDVRHSFQCDTVNALCKALNLVGLFRVQSNTDTFGF